MKSSEKKLVGIAMIAGGIALVFGLGLPQMDAFNANTTKSASLKADLEAAQADKLNLNLQIAMLEKNIAIPRNIQIKTFSSDNEEEAAKELLDHVVNLATDSGNKFVGLSPAKVDPFLTPPKPKANSTATGAPASPTPAPPPANATATTATSPDSTQDASAQASLPLLITKGYELTIRGSYASLQAFLHAMDQQLMVMDMLNFDLENEMADATTGGAAAGDSDPSLPLRLKVTLRLALQRMDTQK
jgi:hypothetical protein